MKAEFELLTLVVLLVAIPALLFTAPKASASIVYGPHFANFEKHPSEKSFEKSEKSEKSVAFGAIFPQRMIGNDTSAVFGRHRLSNGSVANIVQIDMSSGHWRLRTVVNARPKNVAATAVQYNASVAVNGGFFDVRRGASVSYVTDLSRLVADPHESNKSFSPAILNRSELRQIVDENGNQQLVIVRHNEPTAKGVQIEESLQAGPALLPKYSPEAEAFIRKTRKGGRIDAISTASPEARTAIGITASGKLLIVCVETPGRGPDGHGVTLMQLARILKDLGAVQALNLDGGTSTTMVVRLPILASPVHGKVVCGASSMRNVKSVLLLQHF